MAIVNISCKCSIIQWQCVCQCLFLLMIYVKANPIIGVLFQCVILSENVISNLYYNYLANDSIVCD
jgi:hypothetical protein